jgi:PDZ domain
MKFLWNLVFHNVDRCCANYFAEKVVRAYGELKGDLHLVELDRGPQPVSTGGPQSSGSNGQLISSYPSLGLCLAGNRDLGTMSIFVVGFQPGSPAACDGNIRIGDELLEVRMKSLITRHASYLILDSK